MAEPKYISLGTLQKIAGFDVAGYVQIAIDTGKCIKHSSGWSFWLLGDIDDDDGTFYGAVWAFAPNGQRYIIDGTGTVHNSEEQKALNVALCAGRHNIPQATDGAIFPSVIADVTDTPALEQKAKQMLTPFSNGRGCVNLYVTGLTVALVAAINVAIQYHINLILWHYDAQTGNYYPQRVHTLFN